MWILNRIKLFYISIWQDFNQTKLPKNQLPKLSDLYTYYNILKINILYIKY